MLLRMVYKHEVTAMLWSTTIESGHNKVCWLSSACRARARWTDLHFPVDDILVHEDGENPEWMFGAEVTEDGNYVALYTMRDTSRVRN